MRTARTEPITLEQLMSITHPFPASVPSVLWNDSVNLAEANLLDQWEIPKMMDNRKDLVKHYPEWFTRQALKLEAFGILHHILQRIVDVVGLDNISTSLALSCIPRAKGDLNIKSSTVLLSCPIQIPLSSRIWEYMTLEAIMKMVSES
jgi:hypothetical protein